MLMDGISEDVFRLFKTLLREMSDGDWNGMMIYIYQVRYENYLYQDEFLKLHSRCHLEINFVSMI